MEEIEQQVIMAPQEKQEFDEFKRQKRVTEARAVIRKLELNLTQAQTERSALRRAVRDAEKLGIGGICVQPCLVKACSEYLGAGSPVSVVACISPGGGDVTEIKVKQLKRVVKDGADVVEVTAPISAIKESGWGYVKRELKKLRKACKKAALRINIEAPLLTSQELTKFCSVACECEIPCIRTASENFGSGADEEDLKIIKAALKDKAAIKADGADTAGRMSTLADLGASLVGSSAALTLAASILAQAEK